MGIQGLHDACRGSKKKVHVRDYAGMRLAADGYGWLHRGCYSCALHLAQGQQPWLRYGRPPPYVEFCLHRMRMLRHFGVIPCLVFDGDSLPAKEGTDAARKAGRTAKLARARELLAGGDRAAAETLFQQCISVTPAMAHAVILALEAEGFAHLTAPYEADAQLAHLVRCSQADVVATEDGDLVAFGCPIVVFRLDKFGNGTELRRSELFSAASPAPLPPPPAARAPPPPPPVAPPAADGFDDVEEASGDEMTLEENDEMTLDEEKTPAPVAAKGGRRSKAAPLAFFLLPCAQDGDKDQHTCFLWVCALAGCDYLPSLPGLGFKKAFALVSRSRGSLSTLQQLLRSDRWAASDDYLASFSRAVAAFQHATVYDPRSRRQVHLRGVPPDLAAAWGGDVSFLGPVARSQSEAEGLATGRLCPHTRSPWPAAPPPPEVRSHGSGRRGGKSGARRESGAAGAGAGTGGGARGGGGGAMDAFVARGAGAGGARGGGGGGGGGGGAADAPPAAAQPKPMHTSVGALQRLVRGGEPSAAAGGARATAAAAAAAAAHPAPRAGDGAASGGGTALPPNPFVRLSHARPPPSPPPPSPPPPPPAAAAASPRDADAAAAVTPKPASAKGPLLAMFAKQLDSGFAWTPSREEAPARAAGARATPPSRRPAQATISSAFGLPSPERAKRGAPPQGGRGGSAAANKRRK